MADEILKKSRVIGYEELEDTTDSDYLFVDNATSGTHKLKANVLKRAHLTDEQIAAIRQIGAQVLSTIPSDYITISAVLNEVQKIVIGDANAIPFTDWTYNKYINVAPVPDLENMHANTQYRCIVVNCTKGDKFRLNGYGGGSPRLWAFINVNGTVSSMSGVSARGEDLELIVPNNCNKIVINDRDKSGTCYKNNVAITGWSDGYTITVAPVIDLDNPVSNNDYRYLILDCAEGDIFTINGHGGGSPRLWAFLNSNGTVSSMSAVGIVAEDLELVTPRNCTKLVLNDRDKTGIVYIGKKTVTIYDSPYKGKTLSILGDSISTFEGYIVDGNRTFYPRGTVQDVNDTWWMKLINALGMKLDTNNSYSGTTVSTYKDGPNAACLTRCQNLGESPDVIIVFMGINDFNDGCPVGTYDGTTAIPTTTKTFTDAYAVLLDKLLTKYQTSEVWICTIGPCEHNHESTEFPEINVNGETLAEYNQAIIKLANAFGVKVLYHNTAGFRYHNWEVYSTDGLHPTKYGHSLIANNDIRQLDPTVLTRYSTSEEG